MTSAVAQEVPSAMMAAASTAVVSAAWAAPPAPNTDAAPRAATAATRARSRTAAARHRTRRDAARARHRRKPEPQGPITMPAARYPRTELNLKRRNSGTAMTVAARNTAIWPVRLTVVSRKRAAGVARASPRPRPVSRAATRLRRLRHPFRNRETNRRIRQVSDDDQSSTFGCAFQAIASSRPVSIERKLPRDSAGMPQPDQPSIVVEQRRRSGRHPPGDVASRMSGCSGSHGRLASVKAAMRGRAPPRRIQTSSGFSPIWPISSP